MCGFGSRSCSLLSLIKQGVSGIIVSSRRRRYLLCCQGDECDIQDFNGWLILTMYTWMLYEAVPVSVARLLVSSTSWSMFSGWEPPTGAAVDLAQNNPSSDSIRRVYTVVIFEFLDNSLKSKWNLFWNLLWNLLWLIFSTAVLLKYLLSHCLELLLVLKLVLICVTTGYS